MHLQVTALAHGGALDEFLEQQAAVQPRPIDHDQNRNSD
jgi:hypothetical protein